MPRRSVIGANGAMLSPAAARQAIDRVRPQLGQADRERLLGVAGLLQPDGHAALSAVLRALFPKARRELALSSLRQFRARLAQAAADAGDRLTLEVDTQKRAHPKDRVCWFAGDNIVHAALDAHSRAEAVPPTTIEPVAQEGFVPVDTADGKAVVRYFVSYAHKNKKLKDDLLDRLKQRLNASSEFAFEQWDDGEIVPGENWRDEIRRAMSRCHFGLLLVSFSFLNSRFITKEELPQFVPGDQPIGWRRAIPVGLEAVALDGTVDLKGLAELQIFRDAAGRFFSERVTDPPKNRFADELFKQILLVVRRHVVAPPDPSSGAAPRVSSCSRSPWGRAATSVELARRATCAEALVDQAALTEPIGQDESGEWLDRVEDETLTSKNPFVFVPPEGEPTDLAKLKDEARAAGSAGERRDAIEFLMDWARDPQSPPFCALLGESGIGKTTTCTVFAQGLMEARTSDRTLPLPIYLDLRRLGDVAKTSPDLDTILKMVLTRSWRGPAGARASIDPQDVARVVADEGALVIFDGLDEVLVHLTPAAGQQFTRELWRILPAAREPRRSRSKGAAAHSDRQRGKLLISCRTHYFRTVREQTTHLTGEDREGPSARDYRALVLLPFRREQIEEFLRAALPDEDIPKLFALIASIHNLPELAERPYTLSLIAEQIPRLKRAREEGRTVTGVTLYRHVVESWLDRDSGKHQLTRDHKQRVMEHLAAALWKSEKRTWAVDDLEQWLIDFLGDNPRLAAHYTTKDREVLKEDLRTATFLVREGAADFRFAHTSLQEFFLASALYRALRESRPEQWDMAVPSRETLDFLGQLLQEDGDAAIATLKTIRGEYRKGRSELAFRYGLRAYERGWPSHSLVGTRLDGADLRDLRIEGRSTGEPISIASASFRGCRLDRSTQRHAVLDDCDFSKAQLTNAEFLDVRARRASFVGATLTGTIFRQADFGAADFDRASCYGTQFLRSALYDAVLPSSPAHAIRITLCEPDTRNQLAPPGGSVAKFTGHADSVTGVVYAPDGRQLATAGTDGTVRVWDAASGELVRTLRGHKGQVQALTYAPDGRQLATAGDDGTVRVWDAASGELVRTLRGHEGRVGAVGYAPDGRQLATAGDDGTVRVWDAASGERVRTLGGHEGWVGAVAYAPDGRQLAAAGAGRVRVWEAASGERVRTLGGREGRVNAVAYAPDGRQLATAGADGTVRVWDAASGERVRTLRGHEGSVTSVAYAPDGRRLISAGQDGTVRVWDSTSGAEAMQIQYLPDNEIAVMSARDNKILRATDGAWRWLGWVARDPETGELTRYPAETYGPLPPLRANG